MSREILLYIDALAREKNVEKAIVLAALEQALESATKKRLRENIDVRGARNWRSSIFSTLASRG